QKMSTIDAFLIGKLISQSSSIVAYTAAAASSDVLSQTESDGFMSDSSAQAIGATRTIRRRRHSRRVRRRRGRRPANAETTLGLRRVRRSARESGGLRRGGRRDCVATVRKWLGNDDRSNA